MNRYLSAKALATPTSRRTVSLYLPTSAAPRYLAVSYLEADAPIRLSTRAYSVALGSPASPTVYNFGADATLASAATLSDGETTTALGDPWPLSTLTLELADAPLIVRPGRELILQHQSTATAFTFALLWDEVY